MVEKRMSAINCTNIKLVKGNQGTTVKQLQTALKSLNFYDGKIDGDFGSYTEEAVRNFQRKHGLSVDGWVGSVTCTKINELINNTATKYSYLQNGVYVSGPHWVGTGCNKMGQCTPYYCACCSIRQQLAKQGIDNYTQQTIARYAGTTTAGTSHWGIETALATIAKQEKIKIKVEWKNFSDLGSTLTSRFRGLGELISTQNKGVILHTLYQNRWGHYETVKEVNMNNKTCLILNSLGSRCSSPAYCGRKETRTFAYLAQNLAGISQKSLCVLTFE